MTAGAGVGLVTATSWRGRPRKNDPARKKMGGMERMRRPFVALECRFNRPRIRT